MGIELQGRMQRGHGGKRARLQESEIRDRDAILREYYSLTQVTQPKRMRKLGRHMLVRGRTRIVKKGGDMENTTHPMLP